MAIPFPEDLTGSSVGRFVIRSKLGVGGMGEVYYAEDTQLRRPVALKRVSRRFGSDPEARRQVLREAQRASALNSEYIASVHDVVEEHGELFLVMEYVEGETLRQRLQQPMTLEQFFDIATQCAEALMVAHERAIVHCDIKPENIMLTPAGRVKILDFGVAKQLPRSDQSSTMDRSGSPGGTPAYMAPEVLLEKPPDERSDIFSLGVVLYEMLTLKNPFLASSFVATSERVLHETPAAIRAFHPSVPNGLVTVVMKAMAKAPAQRYVHVRELLDDLRLVYGGATPSKLTAVRTRRKEKRWLVAGIVLGVIAVAGFAVYWWDHRSPILGERGWVLVADFETPGEATIPDKGVREALTIALQQSRYINVFPRSRAFEVLQRMKKENATRIDESLGREICQRENLQVLLTGSIDRAGQVFQITVRGLDPLRGSLLFAENERFVRQDEFFDKVDALAKKVRTDLGESLERIQGTSRPLAKVTTTSLEALQLYSQAKDATDQGKDEQVPVLLQGALRLDPDFAMAHMRLGQYYSAFVGKNERALAELDRAYQLRPGVTGREQRRIEAAYYGLLERYDEKAESLRVLASLYPDDEEAHQELASAYYDLGQLDQAVLELYQVLRLNPDSAPAYGNLVLYLARGSKSDAAIAAAGEATRRGIGSPRMHWGLGLAYLGQGNVAAARQEFEQVGGTARIDRELQELSLAIADLSEGKLDAARAALTRQIQTVPAQSGGLQLFRRYLVGRIYLMQANSRAAEFQADLMLQVPSTGLQASDLLSAGTLYARAGNSDKARQVLRRLDESRKTIPSSSNQENFHNMEGEVQLAEAKPEQAAISFAAADEGFAPFISSAGLARAYQAQRRWDLCAQAWEKFISQRNEILQSGFPPDLAVAHLQLARVYGQMNNGDLALKHYMEIVRIWQHADNLPVLRQANHELQDLKSKAGPSNGNPGSAASGPAAQIKSNRRKVWIYSSL
jgi:tetratricopeptide (TPR) repeat protein